jgi:coenzyme PQQ synthesis protein D (PqqD)
VPLRDDQRLTIREDVLSRVLDGEAVLLDLASGTYFGLDTIGTEIWELFKQGVTVAEVRAAIVARYEVDDATVRHDLEELVDEMVKRGLIDVSA